MALVGVIEAGAVERILQSVSFAAGDVLVLFSQDKASGQVLFEKGQIVTARLGELRGEAAVAGLRRWSHGHYTLIKRSQVVEGSRGQVALGLLERRLSRPLERWLKEHGYQTSLIANPQQAVETIVFLRPDLLLLPCPRRTLGVSCAELSALLGREMQLSPAILVLDETAAPFSEPTPPCVRARPVVEELEQMLTLDWSGTRLGVRLASQEETAKIPRPRPRPLPAERSSEASEELLALEVARSLRQGRLTWRDLLLALGVLLFGSSAIWIGLWR